MRRSLFLNWAIWRLRVAGVVYAEKQPNRFFSIRKVTFETRLVNIPLTQFFFFLGGFSENVGAPCSQIDLNLVFKFSLPVGKGARERERDSYDSSGFFLSFILWLILLGKSTWPRRRRQIIRWKSNEYCLRPMTDRPGNTRRNKNICRDKINCTKGGDKVIFPRGCRTLLRLHVFIIALLSTSLLFIKRANLAVSFGANVSVLWFILSIIITLHNKD